MRVRGGIHGGEEEKEEEAEFVREAEVEVEIEEEEDLKQEENVLKEEEDQIHQIILEGGRGPLFTQEQEGEIINMVLANNAIRLR